MAVMHKRHQTSQPSFKVINLPKTPVNPQRKTAMCKRVSAGFIMAQRNEIKKWESRKMIRKKIMAGLLWFVSIHYCLKPLMCFFYRKKTNCSIQFLKRRARLLSKYFYSFCCCLFFGHGKQWALLLW